MTAYIVSTYRYPDQVVRLIRHLASTESNVCLIHHDANASLESWQGVQAGTAGLPNVHYLSRRPFRYATFDHVQVTLDGLRWLSERAIPFHHVVLLTGQCYPLMSAERIEEFFSTYRHRSLITSQPLPVAGWPDGGFARVNALLYGRSTDRLPRALRRCLPERSGWFAIPKPGLVLHRCGAKLRVRVPRSVGTLYGGGPYWALAHHHAEYILSAADPFVRFFKRSHIPDELFFQTMLANSQWRSELVNDSIHEIDWQRGRGMSPHTWTIDDLDRLTGSSRPFARKFDLSCDHDVLDAIDSNIEASR